MKRNLTNRLLGVGLLAAMAALAGPPLICERIDIGNAKSLPWRNVNGWDGTESGYDVSRLAADTMNLLTPAMPLTVRMETLRRASLYAARHERLADQITAQLLARTANAEASGKSDPLAWFDAGYFVETVRQATFIYRYDMLTPVERTQWKLRGESTGLDGKPWVEKAVRMGGRGMEVALAKMDEYRQADLKRSKQLASAK